MRNLLLESQQLGIGPVRHLIYKLDHGPSHVVNHSAAAARAEPSAQATAFDQPPAYTSTTQSSDCWQPQRPAPELRHSHEPLPRQSHEPLLRQRHESATSLTDQDITDDGNTLVDAYFDLLEVPDENRRDKWRADMQDIANKIDRLGSAASSYVVSRA